jgi:hypothetical protein
VYDHGSHQDSRQVGKSEEAAHLNLDQRGKVGKSLRSRRHDLVETVARKVFAAFSETDSVMQGEEERSWHYSLGGHGCMNLANWQGTDEKVNGLSLYSVKVDVPGLKVREVHQQGAAVRWHQYVTTAVPRMGQRQPSLVRDQPVRVST